MPADFNPSFQAPNWGWWIVLYFFVGGVAGGVSFAAGWLDLFGDGRETGRQYVSDSCSRFPCSSWARCA